MEDLKIELEANSVNSQLPSRNWRGAGAQRL
jgi:hypothetical protein